MLDPNNSTIYYHIGICGKSHHQYGNTFCARNIYILPI